MTTINEIEGGAIEFISDKDYRIKQYDFSETRRNALAEIARAEQEHLIDQNELRRLAR